MADKFEHLNIPFPDGLAAKYFMHGLGAQVL
jgi:hypothetical protein